MNHSGFEAEKPLDNVIPMQVVAPLHIVEPEERAEDLLHINVLPTGDTPLDHEIHNYHRWAEKKLHQPENQYINEAKYGAVRHADERRAAENQETIALFKETFSSFFWTGIECSNPQSPEGERWDQLAFTGIYEDEHLDRQLDAMDECQIENVRLGMPNHIMVEQDNWQVFTNILDRFKARNKKVSLDLLHFGLPAAYRNDEKPEESVFLNPDWPNHFIEFGMKAVKTYLPKLDAITIINEPMITNRFSAVKWNEAMPGSFDHPQYDHYFIRRALLIAKAALKARFEIEAHLQEEGRRVIFIHNDSCEHQPDDFHFNEFNRFLASDLILGHEWLLEDDFQKTDMYRWMARHYVRQDNLADDIQHLIVELETIKQYHILFERRFGKTMKADTVFGVDYYMACEIVKPGHPEQLTMTDVKGYEAEIRSDRRKGLARICMEYWNRYQLPILHTETNFFDHGSEEWGMKQLVELAQLPKFGIPVLGFTWYSLMDQFNWGDALSGSPKDLKLHPVGMVSWPGYEKRNFTTTVFADLMASLKQGSVSGTVG